MITSEQLLKNIATPYKNIFKKSATFQFHLYYRQLDNKHEGLQVSELAPVPTKAKPVKKELINCSYSANNTGEACPFMYYKVDISISAQSEHSIPVNICQ